MDSETTTSPEPDSAARHDLIWVGAGALLLWGVSAALELSEHMVALLHRWERYQVDELPGVLLFLAVALAWYAWRRVHEAHQQLGLRRAAEARLASALVENRRLSLSHVALQEEERRQLARELHDELGQHLNAVKLDAVALRDWTAGQPGRWHQAALAIVGSADYLEDTLRGMLRRLRPVGLDELGLAAALEHLVANWRARQGAVRVELAIEGDIDGLAESENITCYRLVQEAINNAMRHAQATEVTVRVARVARLAHLASAADAPQHDRIELRVRDNGVGAASTDAGTGLGLVGMRERIDALGGRFTVQSQPGAGFCIEASLPLRGGGI